MQKPLYLRLYQISTRIWLTGSPSEAHARPVRARVEMVTSGENRRFVAW